MVFEEKPSRKQIIEEIFKLAAEKKLQFKDAGFLDVSDEGTDLWCTRLAIIS